ncbi:ribonuclease E/G [Marinibacterium sp. SX1]|uniref:ribonuclease E/G n=1 Tax=Marinibacterium sp. SX1 TaxID=3388424 RepID=UPI003D16441F
MKGRQILLDHLGDREAAALMVDGQLDDLLIDGDAPAPGTIYRARADRPVKGQGGMFLSTPDGSAFLRQVKGLSPGENLLVQVTGYAEPGKAMPVTTRILFKSRYAIVTPGAPGLNVSRGIRDEDERDRLLEIAHETMGEGAGGEGAGDLGLIVRTGAEGAEAGEIAEDIAAMAELARRVMGDAQGAPEKLVEGDGPHLLAWRDWTDPAEVVSDKGCFDSHGVTEAIDAARGPRVPLAGGGTMYVEPTRALVAVDVNTGADGSMAAGLKANIAAARALPRALRVRGLGGQVVLDLAPLPKKERRIFESALRAAFKSDPVETVFSGWTPLGNFELQRKRARLPLA